MFVRGSCWSDGAFSASLDDLNGIMHGLFMCLAFDYGGRGGFNRREQAVGLCGCCA